MNELELKLKELDPGLFSKFEETKIEVNLLQGKYSENFSTYTDHSLAHTYEVFTIASDLLTKQELDNLNVDEIYILSMACILHDIGMCIPPEKIDDVRGSNEFSEFIKVNPNLSIQDYIRDIHHLLSKEFINKEWELLKIPSQKYASGIALVAAGHRKVELSDFDTYEPRFYPKSGRKFACLPYLSAILRIADELDVTNSRTPRLLTKYYMPNNEISIKEWNKHIATSQRNYAGETIIFEVTCTDQNIYAALQDQFEKIQNVINYCQKVIRSIPLIKDTVYSFSIIKLLPKYYFNGFDPKGIKFSFDVQNVITAFIGENLYKDRYAAIREALQNSIDSCRYKSKVIDDDYSPIIKISISSNSIKIEDNGAGMDDFIVENFFGKLASSFYEQDKIKDHFEAIGQFGVGVFSYFLLAEFIDIETKAKNNKTLKFRFDKDPKSYFHFFDTTERVNSGTTLTITLREDIKKEITYENIEKYIRSTFKHIEIPIEIINGEIINLIEPLPFVIDAKKEIYEKLQIIHRKKNEDIKSTDFYFDCDEFEGVCAIFIGQNYLETFNISEYFDDDVFYTVDNRAHNSEISISQKGVFVNNYSSNYFECVIGLINIKKKLKINIDRNKFSNAKDLNFVLNKFEFEIMRKVFNSLEDLFKNNEERYKVSKDFIINCLNYFPEKNTLLLKDHEFLLQIIYLKIYKDGNFEIVNLKFIDDNCPNVAVAYNENNLNKLIEKGYSNIILDFRKTSDESKLPLRSLFYRFLNYNCSINYIEEQGYYSFEKLDLEIDNSETEKPIHEITGYYYIDILTSNSNKLSLAVTSNFSDEDDDNSLLEPKAINSNHHFIKFIKNNYALLKENSELKKIIKSVIDYVFGYSYSLERFDESSLVVINEMIEPLSKIGYTSKFAMHDFNNFELKNETVKI